MITPREIKIAKKVLDHLHTLNGGQRHPIAIHAEIGGLPFCNTAELDDVFTWLDQRKYIIGVATEFKGTLWSISDLGESARRKM